MQRSPSWLLMPYAGCVRNPIAPLHAVRSTVTPLEAPCRRTAHTVLTESSMTISGRACLCTPKGMVPSPSCSMNSVPMLGQRRALLAWNRRWEFGTWWMWLIDGRAGVQVEEDGIVFFRESCFRQSGDKARKSNPTHYRYASLGASILLWRYCPAFLSAHPCCHAPAA